MEQDNNPNETKCDGKPFDPRIKIGEYKEEKWKMVLFLLMFPAFIIFCLFSFWAFGTLGFFPILIAVAAMTLVDCP